MAGTALMVSSDASTPIRYLGASSFVFLIDQASGTENYWRQGQEIFAEHHEVQ